MAIFVNKTAAKVSAQVNGSMYDFVPGLMTSVDDAEDSKALKKVPLIARLLDAERMVTGTAAKKFSEKTESEIEKLDKQDEKDS